jgi:RNA polymerase sigma-70 factor (ECF subfamily)
MSSVNPASPALEDDELMLRVQGGDGQAFEQLVERHQGPLWGFFYRNTRDAQFAEDLTQETLLRVYNQAWDYLPRGRFRGWMYRIARNLLIDSVRRQSHDALVKAVRGRSEDDTDGMARLTAEIVPPEIHASQREMSQLVDRLLDELPEEQRLTFTLYLYLGLPLPEVAEIMDVSVPTTKSRLRLAREKLRDLLRTHGVTVAEVE